MQDDGGTANGGVDLDPDRQHDDHRRDLGQRRPGRRRQHRDHARGHGLHLHGRGLRLQRRQRQPGQHAAGGDDHDAPGRRQPHEQRRGRHGRPVDHPGGHHRRAPGLHAGRQRQRRRLRELHLPGPGHGGTANGGVDLDPTANTMTIDVTSVNDAPAGADNTVTTLEDTALHLHGRGLRLQRRQRQPGQHAAGGDDHHAPGRRAASRTTAWPSRPASRSRLADITAGRLVFTPAANANGAGYASFTFQVQDTAAPPTAASISIRPPTR